MRTLRKSLLAGILFYFFVLDSLGKNLLLPNWGCFREESFASLLGILWGRIFCFLAGDCFNVLRSIGEEFFASSMRMMLDMLELLRKSLLLPI